MTYTKQILAGLSVLAASLASFFVLSLGASQSLGAVPSNGDFPGIYNATTTDLVLRDGFGSALAVDVAGRLIISPSSTFANASSITLGLGTVGAPSLNFVGDSNTGVYSSAADHVNLSAGGAGVGWDGTAWYPNTNNAMDLGTAGTNAWRNIYASGTISVAGGSASVPAINFGISGSNTGLFSSAANNVQVTIGGTAVNAWTASTFRGVTNNTTNLGTTSIAFGNIYASGTTIAFRNLGAPGVTSDFVCWSATTGGVLVHQTANCTVSSARFKDNIASLSTFDLLAKAMKLRAVSFNLKADGKASAGFIAEEVARVLPDLVVYTSEYTPEGLAFIQENYPDVVVMNGDTPMIPQTLDYERLTYVLTGALQAQQEQLNGFETRLQAVEAKGGLLDKFNAWLKAVASF